jgi:uncharacterized protein (TIGR00369 family)
MQGFMRFLGAQLQDAGEGSCVIALPARPELSQQHGFVHAGAIGAIADTAAGYAALSLWPEGSDVLTVEYKLNLVAPATGQTVVARAEVVRAGGSVTVCETRVFSVDGGEETLCAIALVTLLRREGR